MSSFPKWPSEWKAWSNECNGVAYDPCWNRNSDCICDVCDLVCDVCDLVTKGCVEFFALGVKPQLKFIGLLPSHLSPALKTENSCRHHETQTVTQKRINYLLTLCISIEQCHLVHEHWAVSWIKGYFRWSANATTTIIDNSTDFLYGLQSSTQDHRHRL